MGEDIINLKQLINKSIRFWYLFAASIAIAVGFAYYKIKTTTPNYSAAALMLIDEEKSSGDIDQEYLFQDLGLFSSSTNLENQIVALKSTPLMIQVVNNLHLNYEYYKVSKFRNYILYNISPVEVLDWKPADPEKSFSGEVLIKNDGDYELIVKDQTYGGEFGTPLKTDRGEITLTYKRELSVDYPILIKISPVKPYAQKIISRLDVGLEVVGSSTLRLDFKDESRERAIDILNELIEVYFEDNVNDKKQVYENSIDLINERIRMVNTELSSAEQSVERYRSRYNATDLSAEGSLLLQEVTDYNRQLSQTDIQIEILNSIENFLAKNRENFEFVPTNLELNNLTLSNQLQSFNEIIKQRARMATELGPANPEMILIERQIKNLRATIINNIISIRKDLEIKRNANAELRNNIESRMRSIPRQERQLVEMTRQSSVKENLYLYLMQKREESIISLSVTIPNGRVIEPALASNYPISPKKNFILGLALVIGLLIPTALIFLLELFNNKIRLEDDIRDLTDVPIGGLIPLNSKSKNLVVSANSRSAESEMFRLLRANLKYLFPGQNIQTLLVTSSMTKEGKSFITYNLGMAMAIAGKKTVIVDLDLRKPQQQKLNKINKEGKGVVHYIEDPSLKAADLVHVSNDSSDLHIISCGTIPPNPGELILSDRIPALLEELKQQYDFVIIDTPPVGMVSDPLQLSELAEATMFVVRTKYTSKSQLKIVQAIADQGKLPNPFIVINGISLNRRGAAYSHKYGYNSVSKGYFTMN
jgi:capsular exopolysaccharide synthesis family protein